MPFIGIAMGRSLGERRGVLDLVAASLRPLVQKRDVSTAFSSWDNCMQATYCKWPAIALMIIAGLIIFSVVWCMIRCMCCGLSCCCTCFSCLRCCGCGCCCDPPRDKQHKYLDAPFVPPDQGYRSEPAMGMPAVSASRFDHDHDPPKYATYEVVHKADDDALPSMPSPEGESKKEFAENGLELSPMARPAVGTHAGAGAWPGPLNTSGGGISPPPNRAHSPVGQAAWDAQQAGGHGTQAYNQGGYGSRGFTQGGAPTGHPTIPVLGEHGGAFDLAPARTHSPRLPNNINNNNNHNGWDQPRRSPMPPRQATYDMPAHPNYDSPPARAATYDNSGLSRQGSFDNYGQTTQGNQGYGMDPRRSPRPMAGAGGGGGGYPTPVGRPMNNNRSPAPPQGDYGGHPAGRSYSPATPARQYSAESTRPLTRPALLRQDAGNVDVEPAMGSPVNLMNNSGFDFNSGFSRPSTANGYNGSVSSQQGQASQPPLQQQGASGGGGGGGGAYPGMRSYQPASPF